MIPVPVDSSSSRVVHLEDVVRLVADYYKVPLKDMLSPCRLRSLVEPRHIAFHLARKFTAHSLEEIGSAVGGRDHTTVLHGLRCINRDVKTNDVLASRIAILERAITEAISADLLPPAPALVA